MSGQPIEGSALRIPGFQRPVEDIQIPAMQLELTPDNFLVFTNSRTEKVNVIYRRSDGHFGLIQPSD